MFTLNAPLTDYRSGISRRLRPPGHIEFYDHGHATPMRQLDGYDFTNVSLIKITVAGMEHSVLIGRTAHTHMCVFQ